MATRVALATKKEVGYHGSYAVIVPDHGPGDSGVYTVYLLPAHATCRPWEAVQIVGRELPWEEALRIAKEAKFLE